MNRSQKVISLQQSSKYVPYPFFKGKKETSMYGNMFFDDFCRYFSIDLGKKNNYRYFYKIDGDDGSLENLLEYDNHMFFQYDFDKLLMNNLANLLTYGKAYVEVVKLFDKDNKLVGIKLLAFRNNIQISLGDKIYYFLRRYDGKIERGRIDKENVISFSIKDLGYTRRFIRSFFRKLRRFDSSLCDLLMDCKCDFEFDVYEKKEDLKLLKVGNKLRWFGRKYDNYYINEPYLVYLRMEELKLKEKILIKLLHKYNEKLSKMGQKYGFTGKINFETKILNFDELYMELVQGIKNCEQVSNEIYG